MAANRNHPMRSSIVAEEMITVPNLLFNKLRSIKILLITGRAEIERAVPINKAKGRILSLAGVPHISGTSITSPYPIAKGIEMPNRLVQSMFKPLVFNCPGFNSIPTTSRNSTMETVRSASLLIKILAVDGKIKA
jgi:hypothetical protein